MHHYFFQSLFRDRYESDRVLYTCGCTGGTGWSNRLQVGILCSLVNKLQVDAKDSVKTYQPVECQHSPLDE
jgi:hypothetical protein